MTTNPVASDRTPVLVDFALQGGGAHGAFTWGVLDRLLEEPWLGIDGGPGAWRCEVLSRSLVGDGARIAEIRRKVVCGS